MAKKSRYEMDRLDTMFGVEKGNPAFSKRGSLGDKNFSPSSMNKTLGTPNKKKKKAKTSIPGFF